MRRSVKVKRRRTKAHLAELNITPLIDVMLVLLVIFMVSAPMMTTGVPLDLPSGKKPSSMTETKQPLTVSIDKDAKVFIMDKEVTQDELSARLSSAGPEAKADRVYLRADKSLKYSVVASVMSILSNSGFAKIALIMEGKE